MLLRFLTLRLRSGRGTWRVLRGVLAAFVGGLAMNVWRNGVTYHVEVEGWCCSSKDEVSPPARFIRVLIYEHGEIVPSKLGRLKDSPEVFRVPEYFSRWLFVRSPANLMTSQPPFRIQLTRISPTDDDQPLSPRLDRYAVFRHPTSPRPSRSVYHPGLLQERGALFDLFYLRNLEETRITPTCVHIHDTVTRHI
jgi:hypothetical protein